MAPLRPPVPQTLDVVPASEVGELIARTDRDFVELEARVETLRGEAAEAEQLAAAEGVDPSSSTWTMVRLQRFLDGLRDETRRDADATVEVARQRARVRVAEARLAAGLPVSDPPHTPFAYGSPNATWATPTNGATPAPASPAAPLVPPAGAPVADQTMAIFMPPTPLTPPASPPSSPPSTSFEGGAPAASVLTAEMPAAVNGSAAHAADDFWRDVPEAGAAVVAPVVATTATVTVPEAATPAVTAPADPLLTLAPPAPAPAAPAPAAPAPVSAKEAKRAEKQARKDADAAAKAQATAGATPKDSLFKRLPVTAALEVLAVLLILVFILLRLS